MVYDTISISQAMYIVAMVVIWLLYKKNNKLAYKILWISTLSLILIETVFVILGIPISYDLTVDSSGN